MQDCSALVRWNNGLNALIRQIGGENALPSSRDQCYALKVESFQQILRLGDVIRLARCQAEAQGIVTVLIVRWKLAPSLIPSKYAAFSAIHGMSTTGRTDMLLMNEAVSGERS